MVYYRKYRPQQIDELDNSDVREKLLSILAKDTPHAFLFTGPKGLGKTSAARIVAKAVNCEKNKEPRSNGVAASPEPCNVCDACVSITTGTNLDVLEIDAASNRGIDEIRELKDKIRLSPVAADKKVYIIDEVHMLTTEAFNALLKTLEEPPSHVLFILCTTEVHKIPATILSRCMHLHFHTATHEELIRSFTRIAKGENLSIDNQALSLIARLSEGGFRDGAKILEEVVALSQGKQITAELIEEKYHLTRSSDAVAQLLSALTQHDAKAGLEVIEQLIKDGIEIKQFVQELLKTLHEEMLRGVGLNQSEVKLQNVQLSLPQIQAIFAQFSHVSTEMKTSVLPQLPLELAVIAYCNLPASAKQAQQEAVENNLSSPIADEEGVTVSTLRKKVGAIKKQEALYGTPKQSAKEEKEVVKTTNIALEHVPKGEITKEWLDALWKSIITEMKTHNHTIAGVLRGCRIKSYDAKVLVVQANYPFHKERLDEAKTREALHMVAKLLTGKEVEVAVELKG